MRSWAPPVGCRGRVILLVTVLSTDKAGSVAAVHTACGPEAEARWLSCAQNGKPPPPMPQLPPLPPPSKEELAVMEQQVKGLPPARKAALAWAMKARAPS